MSFALHQIPGYLEALNQAKSSEFATREDAWWDFTFDVGGVLIRTMTVQDYELLLRQHSPLLLKCVPNPEEMINFLWILSPANDREVKGFWANRKAEKSRQKHRKLCELMLDLKNLQNLENQSMDKSFIIPEDSAFAGVFSACIKYIDRMFFDKPAGVKSNGVGSGMCYLTDWFCTLQREFGLPTKEIESMPLPELFARLKEVQQFHNDKIPDFNAKADDLNRQIMDALRGGMTEQELLDGKLKFRLN